MQRILIMIKLFQREPLWFKSLILFTLLISIILSSSIFSGNYYQGGSKAAAAIFFFAYGVKMRRNVKISILMFALAVVCLVLAVLAIW
ncbi:hypothetical protein [Peribacillus deserti]|uniref:Uncharacterized protein n=1 Tax=Peribacillus deserti TaxID=673318 RepID=A0A2N5M615_9BACI|nr:hypothetical protein [Peribacillus deserti]PLT29785.1 hypothetical protein CUU66_10800 [Peribacillus deserti]